MTVFYTNTLIVFLSTKIANMRDFILQPSKEAKAKLMWLYLSHRNIHTIFVYYHYKKIGFVSHVNVVGFLLYM